MTMQQKLDRGEMLRQRMAYFVIACGLKIHAAGARLGLREKNAEYHWSKALQIIRKGFQNET